MITVACVLKSGGVYDASWVQKLKDGVARNMKRPHRFLCLSDVDVPCERVELVDNFPGWWSKIELFRQGAIPDGTLYLDLDTVVTGSLDDVARLNDEFLMLQNFNDPEMVGSGVMWFGTVPHKVYDKFRRQPEAYINHYERNREGSYLGDQAFIWDTLGRDISLITDRIDGIRSYKKHCKNTLLPDTRVVCFHGEPRPTEVKTEWMQRHWG